MKKEGYGDGYVYDHDTEHAFAGHNCFPHDMKRQTFIIPRRAAMRGMWQSVWRGGRKDDTAHDHSRTLHCSPR